MTPIILPANKSLNESTSQITACGEIVGSGRAQTTVTCDDKENDITYLQNEIQQLEGYLSRLGSNS